MVREAMELNARTRHEVNQKLGLLQGFLAELQAKASHYRDIAAEIGMDLDDHDDDPRPARR
jgi:hypothetical protein